jgi:ubiquinone/menaquinone biosynthesis C-methylase UbiE
MFPAVRARGPLAGGLLPEVVARAASCSGESVARAALELLELQPTDAVLELGCGSGRLLSAVAARLRRGRIAGVDPSELMVRHARVRNRRWIALGRADIQVGHSGELGRYGEGSFDKVYGTHVVYFWTEPQRDLAEIRRVLRPSGRLLLGFFPMEPCSTEQTRFSRERAEQLLVEAGFGEVRGERRWAGGGSLAWVRATR